MAAPIRAIVGLGNPGPRYFETRHNAGFWFLDAYVRRAGVSLRGDSRMHAEIGSVGLAAGKCWLVRPDCFMNRSGLAVQALTSYYKIDPDELLVVYDELDLPPGVARFKSGGGHGGHNGLRDITRHIGNGFNRLRLGVGHPGHKDQVVDYVLGKPRREEREAIDDAIDESLRVIDQYVVGERGNATTALHTATRPVGGAPDDSNEAAG